MAIIFKSHTTKRKPIHKPLLACDVENNPSTGKFINAALFGYISEKKWVDGKTQYVETKIDKFFDKQQNFLDYLSQLKSVDDKHIPCKLIFFNLSYDYWFLTSIVDDAAMLSSGTRIITGRLKNGIPLLDLTNHVDYTLEDWIGFLDMEKKWGIKKESLDNLEARVKSDTRATYELGHFLEDFYVYELGIPFKLTVASTSRYLFALHFFKDYWYRDEKKQWINKYEREGYRGGRCEVFKRGERHVRSYDVNSMYLNVMYKQKLPDPNSAHYVSSPTLKQFFTSLFGASIPKTKKDMLNLSAKKIFIADVTVNVPEQYVPPLPYKHDNKPENKLIFPVGTFTAKFYSPELVYAIKNCGVTIKKVHSYVSYESEPYFKEYAEFIWKKRKEYKAIPNLGMDMLIKKLGNSLYGGFGQRNPEWTYFGKLKDFEGYVGVNSTPDITKINGVEYISCGDTTKNDSSHTFPCLPGFITSYARVDLLTGLKADVTTLVYCDTDSKKDEGDSTEGIKVGNELGEWGFEYEKTQEFYKPKMYGDKIKGVPKRAQLVYTEPENRAMGFPNTVTYVFRKPNRMKESIKRGLMPDKWEYVVKEISIIDDKRVWDETGLESRPINVQDLERDEKLKMDMIMDKSKDVVYKKMQKAKRVQAREYIKETDNMDVDMTLIKEEREEDAISEMRRYMN